MLARRRRKGPRASSGARCETRGALGALILVAASSASAAPLPTRDQNPFLAGFGLPMPMAASVSSGDEWSFAADFNWGNTSLVQTSDNEALIVDAETREGRLTLRRALTRRIALQMQVPYRYVGAGSLDGFIDDWHEVFGLPEGARPILPQDRLRIAYARNGATLLDMHSSHSGLGDIAFDVGYDLRAAGFSSVAAWLSIEAPTGDANGFASNGAIDASLILAGERRFANRWSIFAQAGVTWLGEGELLPYQQREIVWSGLAGLSWRAFRQVELKVQLDAHTAALGDSELDFLDKSITLTIGGTVNFSAGWRIDLGVSEDVAVETGPDVVFILGVRRGH